MLALGRGCKHRLLLAKTSDCAETIINFLLADLYQTNSGPPLILHYGKLYNYFIIYHNVIIIETKCTINVMCLNHPQTISLPYPTPVHEKTIFCKTGPWCQEGWGSLFHMIKVVSLTDLTHFPSLLFC